jgi:hypothetical protein
MCEEIIIPIYLKDLVPEVRDRIKEIVDEIQAADWDVIPLTELCLGIKDKGDDGE